jgi:hypothetical protein
MCRVTGVFYFVCFVLFCTRNILVYIFDELNGGLFLMIWPVPSRAHPRVKVCVVLCYRLNFDASRTVVVVLLLLLLLVILLWSTTTKQLVDMVANILVHVRVEDGVDGGLTEGMRQQKLVLAWVIGVHHWRSTTRLQQMGGLQIHRNGNVSLDNDGNLLLLLPTQDSGDSDSRDAYDDQSCQDTIRPSSLRRGNRSRMSGDSASLSTLMNRLCTPGHWVDTSAKMCSKMAAQLRSKMAKVSSIPLG